jgi:SAM-dependent methyltransferase
MEMNKRVPAQPANPWLQVPASEYEGHMNSPAVRQSKLLNRFFADTLVNVKPQTVLVCGCSTGNGLEHIDPEITSRVVGFDINPDYIRIAGERYKRRLPFLELYCTDIDELNLSRHSFDLIVASLFFEYVTPAEALPKLVQWLRPGGQLAVILQLPVSGAETVTPTPFKRLRLLAPIIRLIQPRRFKRIGRQLGLYCVSETEITLRTGKAFYAAYLKLIDRSES